MLPRSSQWPSTVTVLPSPVPSPAALPLAVSRASARISDCRSRSRRSSCGHAGRCRAEWSPGPSSRSESVGVVAVGSSGSRASRSGCAIAATPASRTIDVTHHRIPLDFRWNEDRGKNHVPDGQGDTQRPGPRSCRRISWRVAPGVQAVGWSANRNGAARVERPPAPRPEPCPGSAVAHARPWWTRYSATSVAPLAAPILVLWESSTNFTPLRQHRVLSHPAHHGGHAVVRGRGRCGAAAGTGRRSRASARAARRAGRGRRTRAPNERSTSTTSSGRRAGAEPGAHALQCGRRAR